MCVPASTSRVLKLRQAPALVRQRVPRGSECLDAGDLLSFLRFTRTNQFHGACRLAGMFLRQERVDSDEREGTIVLLALVE